VSAGLCEQHRPVRWRLCRAPSPRRLRLSKLGIHAHVCWVFRMYRFLYDRAMLIRTPVETLHSPLRCLKTASRPKGSMESRYHVPNTKVGCLKVAAEAKF
jgi:hypothetical protein